MDRVEIEVRYIIMLDSRSHVYSQWFLNCKWFFSFVFLFFHSWHTLVSYNNLNLLVSYNHRSYFTSICIYIHILKICVNHYHNVYIFNSISIIIALFAIHFATQKLIRDIIFEFNIISKFKLAISLALVDITN